MRWLFVVVCACVVAMGASVSANASAAEPARAVQTTCPSPDVALDLNARNIGRGKRIRNVRAANEFLRFKPLPLRGTGKLVRGWIRRDHKNPVFWALATSYERKNNSWLSVDQQRTTESFRHYRRFLNDLAATPPELSCGGEIRLTNLNGDTLAAVIHRADGFVAVNTRKHPRALRVLASPGPTAEARAVAAASALTRNTRIPTVPPTTTSLNDIPPGGYTWDELVALGVPTKTFAPEDPHLPRCPTQPTEQKAPPVEPPFGNLDPCATRPDPHQTINGIGVPPPGVTPDPSRPTHKQSRAALSPSPTQRDRNASLTQARGTSA